MTTQTITSPDVRRALVWGALLAALWVVVAVLRPTTTFHLAPLLIAGAPPVLLVLDEGVSASRRAVMGASALGTALALGTAAAVALAGLMRGPAYQAFSGPFGEAVAFTALGAIAGIGFAWWQTR
ncbi:MAG: hypothetical protein ABFR89_01070 [Actinomycetota bacterium]